MKKRYLASIFVVLVVFQTEAVFAQKSTPQVPITYPGDTAETIKRRTQWIEGAKKEGVLEWWGSTSPSEARGITSDFNKVYPFIHVNFWRGRGEEVAAKLDAEHTSGRSTADVAIGGEHYNYPRWRKLGVTDSFTQYIPMLEKMDKREYSRHGDWAIAGQVAVIPQYNTISVKKAEAPKSWDDLLDPKWKGAISITTDVKAWVALALEEGGWGRERTENFLRKLRAQQLLWSQGHTAAHSLILAGEFKILGEGYIHHVIKSQERGAPVDWVRVSPIPMLGSSFTLMKKAPHPNAARLFLEWMFSPSGLASFENNTGKGAVYPGAGTRMANLLEGLSFVYRSEEAVLKEIDLHLGEKYLQILQGKP